MSAPLEVAAWIVTRLWAVLAGVGSLPYPAHEGLFGDVGLYRWWAGNIADGHFPINDPMWQYPPLAAALFALAYALAPGVAGFVVLALVADYAIFAALRRAGKRSDTRAPAVVWIGLALAMGPIVLGRFDVFPTALCIAAMLSTSPAARGSWWAAGAMLKVWPGLGLLAVARRDLPRTVAGFAGTAAALSVGMLMWWPSAFSFIAEQRSRGLQVESLAALPYMLWGAGPGTTATAYQFGALEVVATHTGLVSLVATAVMVALLASVVRWRWLGRLDDIPVPDMMLALVLAAMVTSRVLSPQYMQWALGVAAVCWLRPSARLGRVTALLFISAACGQAIYPWLYGGFLQGATGATIVQVVRLAALVWATVDCWRPVIAAGRHPVPSRPASPEGAQRFGPRSTHA